MREFEIVEVPATTRKRVTTMSCDICGKDIPYKYDKDRIETVTIEISKTTEVVGDDKTSWTEEHFDICPSCYDDVIVKVMEEVGAKPGVTEDLF